MLRRGNWRAFFRKAKWHETEWGTRLLNTVANWIERLIIYHTHSSIKFIAWSETTGEPNAWICKRMIVVKILTEILKPLERVAGVMFQRTDQTQGAFKWNNKYRPFSASYKNKQLKTPPVTIKATPGCEPAFMKCWLKSRFLLKSSVSSMGHWNFALLWMMVALQLQEYFFLGVFLRQMHAGPTEKTPPDDVVFLTF